MTHSWLRRIAGTLGAMLLCACVALFVGVTVLPRVFGIELRTVVSGSMEPSIQKGALVVASPVSASDIHAGDVIMFRAPDGSGRVITHRVAAIDDVAGEPAIHTRGDANNENDPWTVTSHDVLGRVRGDIPHAGTIVEKIRSRAGFAVLMVLPALIVVAGEASVWRRFLRERAHVHAGPVAVRASKPSGSTAPGSYPYPSLEPAIRRRAPSPFILAAIVMTLAASAVAIAMFVLAPRPSAPDANERIASEAASIAAHSGTLANAEAFDGDIQILRNADDARLREPATPPEDRATALRQMLLLNTNRFDAFTLADLHGAPLAATDDSFGAITAHAAYLEAAATGSVAMSAVVSASGDASIDYAAPVRDGSGSTVGILVGRTTPARLWTTTLAAEIDGSVNLLLDGEGRALSIAPASSAWTPASATAPAAIGGVPSVCGQAAIGRDTHLDQGWTIASCLPLALATPAASFPLLRFGVNAVAVVLVVFSAALLLLAWFLGERDRTARELAPPAGLKAIEARLLAQREGPGPR
jgi:signal peptidase